MHNFINRNVVITLLEIQFLSLSYSKALFTALQKFQEKKTKQNSRKSNNERPRNHFPSKKSMNIHIPEVPRPPLIYFHCVMMLVWRDGILRNERWILPNVACSNVLKSFCATGNSSSVLTGVSETTLCKK